MNRRLKHALGTTALSLGLLAAVPAQAGTLSKVSSWGASGVPTYVSMYIFLPTTLAAKPPILVACHSCGTSVMGYKDSIKQIQAAADANGFILILPEATGRNCWDVGSDKSLKHDGGGDTQAVAQMVKYALNMYDGDASRVYIMGGSSGAMMTQAMLAVYPDIFRAGSARAGVPAGCWAADYKDSNQWSDPCSKGTTTHTAMQWGDMVRAMYPSYTGHRPRVQLFQGMVDGTISYNNMAESIRQWTNILALAETPTSTDAITTPVAMYNRKFWKNACDYQVLESWSAPGKDHSMAYEEDAILAFFGLDTKGGTDPEPECPPGGTGGAGGTGGVSSSGGASGTSGAGFGGSPSAGGAPGPGNGGMPGSAGSGPVGTGGQSVSAGTGGSGATAGRPNTGGTPSAGGPGTGGTTPGASGRAGTTGGSPNGGAPGSSSAGRANAGGPNAAGSGAAGSVPEPDAAGCGCVIGETQSKPAYAAALAFGLGLLAFRRRNRSRRA